MTNEDQAGSATYEIRADDASPSRFEVTAGSRDQRHSAALTTLARRLSVGQAPERGALQTGHGDTVLISWDSIEDLQAKLERIR